MAAVAEGAADDLACDLGGDGRSQGGDRRGLKGEGRSFVVALHKKFDDEEQPLQFAILIAKSAPRKTKSGELVLPEHLSLSDAQIMHAGDMSGVSRFLGHVTELDLSCNQLQQWSEVFRILSHLPLLHFLNLSNNPLHLSPLDPADCVSYRNPQSQPRASHAQNSKELSPMLAATASASMDAVSINLRESGHIDDIGCSQDHLMTHQKDKEISCTILPSGNNSSILDMNPASDVVSSNLSKATSSVCDATCDKKSAIDSSQSHAAPASHDCVGSESREAERFDKKAHDDSQSKASVGSGGGQVNVRLDNITQLVLNSTKLGWAIVTKLLSLMPSLNELHLSFNDYSTVDVDPCLSFPSVTHLHFNGNLVSSWSQLERLGRLFPNVANLVVMDNPLMELSQASGGAGASVGMSRGSGGAVRGSESVRAGDVMFREGLEGNSERLGGDSMGFAEASVRASEMLGEDSASERLAGSAGIDSDPEKNLNSEERSSSKSGEALLESHEVEMESRGMELKSHGAETELGEVGAGSGAVGSEFRALRSLCLMRTQVGSWGELEKLRRLPCLVEVKVIGIPFLQKIEEKLRRLLLIGYLPNIERLNGSAVSEAEREDAERAFIRHYMDRADRPDRYAELERVHGKLLPLVNLDLGAPTVVSVTIQFGDRSVLKRVSVHTTAQELKRALAQEVVRKPPRTFVMYHYCGADGPAQGLEVMAHPNRTLLNYRVMDGDQIICELK